MRKTSLDLKHSTLSIIHSLLKYYNIQNIPLNSNEKLDRLLETKKFDNIIVLLYDGFGEYAMKKLDKQGFFNTNRFETLSTLFPTTTAAVTNSYDTGLEVISHAFLGWTLFFKEYTRAVDVFPRYDHYFGEQLPVNFIPQSMRHKTIFEYLKEVEGLNVVSLRPSGIKADVNFNQEDGFSLDILTKYIKKDQRNFLYYYNTDPDSTAHKYGVSSKETLTKINDIQKAVQELSNKLVGTNTLILLFADHGLVDVNKYYYLNEFPEIMKMLIMLPSIESRAATFFVKPQYINEFKILFNKLFPEFILLNKEEVYQEQLFGYSSQINEKVDDFLGDYLAIAIGDAAFNYKNDLIKTHELKAAHAGLTDDEVLVTVIAITK